MSLASGVRSEKGLIALRRKKRKLSEYSVDNEADTSVSTESNGMQFKDGNAGANYGADERRTPKQLEAVHMELVYRHVGKLMVCRLCEYVPVLSFSGLSIFYPAAYELIFLPIDIAK